MPRTDVVFYRDDDGSVPVLEWLDGLTFKARLKCLVRLERLRELGHELRRPEADLLRDGIYKLRISLKHVQYRILYAFYTEPQPVRAADTKAIKKGSLKKRHPGESPARRTIAVVAHGITKEGQMLDRERQGFNPQPVRIAQQSVQVDAERMGRQLRQQSRT